MLPKMAGLSIITRASRVNNLCPMSDDSMSKHVTVTPLHKALCHFTTYNRHAQLQV